jgi:CheY-like chemotaxis protein
VDDGKALLRAAEVILRREGYHPIVALSPIEALEKARDFQGEIHLLLTDINMPGMDGGALAQQIGAERRDIRVLLMTANANAQYRLPLLKKPFRAYQLLDKVREVLDGPTPSASGALAGDASLKTDRLGGL